MRIGLLGGSFDPVHNGHLRLAEGAQTQLKLDQILWIPAHLPPHKKISQRVQPEERASMVELAIQGHPSFHLCRIELERAGPSYTIDTVRGLQAQSKDGNTEYFFLIGSDAAEGLMRWKQIHELLTLVRFAVVPRPGVLGPAKLTEGVIPLQVETLDISASQVRERIRKGQSIEGLVPDAVCRMIEERGWYR